MMPAIYFEMFNNNNNKKLGKSNTVQSLQLLNPTFLCISKFSMIKKKKKLEGHFIEFPGPPVRFQDISPSICVINYTRKLEHKCEMHNPNQVSGRYGRSWLVHFGWSLLSHYNRTLSTRYT